MGEVNIDALIDYRREYEFRLQGCKVSGDRLTARCPFHDDRNSSFSVNLKTGQWHCFAEGRGGNYIEFLAELDGKDTKTVYKEILDAAGIKSYDPEKPYTVEDYAREKALPLAWLRSDCGLETDSSKIKGEDKKEFFVKIPYRDETGKPILYRKRFPAGAPQRFKWSFGAAGKLTWYGLWRLPQIREAGYVIIVEGESDAQTLWHHGFPALGVPGASTIREEWARQLQGLAVYLHLEPDMGGKTFLRKAAEALLAADHDAPVYSWSCARYGAKDPSALHLQKPEEAAELIQKALDDAPRVDLEAVAVEIPHVIEDAPIHLREPIGWHYSDAGVFQIDEKTHEPKCICRTPVILTRRLRSTESQEEKVEVAFKRDGAWKSARFERSTVFHASRIISLADMGCTVTSENAKQLVKFLQALEEVNVSTIEIQESTGSLGWQTKGRFIPGLEGDLVLDVDPSMQGFVSGYAKAGSLDGWKKAVAVHRERYRFRFILAAAFAAPLLRILRHRTFIVYNWGGSRGGKTAALKAALSAWGDPEKTMASFNATNVGLERMSAFYCDLPLGIDERQLAGTKQDFVEKIVYMIASEKSKVRGAKAGGVQKMDSWRTVAIATGEEPIMRENSQGGVNTRVLEIVGAPFADEASASIIHQLTALHHGWSGPEFVRQLSGKETEIAQLYAEISDAVAGIAAGQNGAHVSSIAVVTLADLLLSMLIFGEEEGQAKTDAIMMSIHVLQDIDGQHVQDVNDAAAQFVADWVGINKDRSFRDLDKGIITTQGPCYGFLQRGIAYIYASALQEALQKAGFSVRKTLNAMAEAGQLIRGPDGKNSIVKRPPGCEPGRFIAVNVDRILGIEIGSELGEGEQDEHMPF